jgi:type I restriction-modification system DNA methylase subunit
LRIFSDGFSSVYHLHFDSFGLTTGLLQPACASRLRMQPIVIALKYSKPDREAMKKSSNRLRTPEKRATNLLFFERSGPTREVWYYEQPLPAGRKNYTKTKPIQFEEFRACLDWWHQRAENERAWRVPAEQIAANEYNLDIKNPNSAEELEHLPPEALAESILQKEQRIAELMQEIKQVVAGGADGREST